MSATRLHIAMPFSRPQHMPVLARYYLEEMVPHPFELRWHVMVQGPDADPKGQLKCDEAIDFIKDGWLFTFNDDTLHHPDLFRRLAHEINNHPDAGAIVFGQEGEAGMFPPLPDRIWNGAQTAWRRDFLGSHRHNFEKNGQMGDIIIFNELFEAHPERFYFVNDALLRFNSLDLK